MLAIGNYDGVHLGHQHIIQLVHDSAKSKNLPSVLLTFEPHPVKVLAGAVAPHLINTIEQKIELLQRTNLDAVIFQNFTTDFSEQSPESFFETILKNDLNARKIFVGYDFTFGHERKGNVELLEKLCQQNNTEFQSLPAFLLDKMTVRSSLVRSTLSEKNIVLTNQLLGRAFFIDGMIVSGHKRGTALGIHTANLASKNELLPPDGVWASKIQVGEKTYDSITNIGFNPTFANKDRSIETHIFDFEQDIYDQDVRLHFLNFLRDEIRFATPEALVKQIKKDIETTKTFLKSCKTSLIQKVAS